MSPAHSAASRFSTATSPKTGFDTILERTCIVVQADSGSDTRYQSDTRGHVSIQYSNPNACAGCVLKDRCTDGRYRRINRWENEAVLDRMAVRPGQPARHPRGAA